MRANSGKFLGAAGVLCFALAFVLAGVFKGEFGKDTAGYSTSELVEMEDAVDATPKASASEPEPQGEPRRVVATESAASTASAKWVIYVTGAVKKPGVYEVPPSSRVFEALSAAGGFAQNADQEAVNLAAKLTDGAHIKFPRKGETQAVPAQTSVATPTASSYSTSAQSGGKININTATQEELETLSGVGPKTARSIIEYRESKGSFSRIEDIMNIKGIGAKKFDKLKDGITVGN